MVKGQLIRSGKMRGVVALFVLMLFSVSSFGQVSYFNIEAENMTLTNYIVNTNSAALNGSLIKLNAAGVTGDATTTFSGPTGTYDIRVWYFDESDGACTFNVYVGGTKIDSWAANQNLGSADPVQATRTCRIMSSVSIANGAEIKLEGVQNSQEWGRYDNIEIYTHGYQPPTVNIITPSDNSVFNSGDSITISTNVTSVGSNVTKVEFYQGTTKLGESTTSPFAYTWRNVPAGSYTLTAKVTDNVGVTQTSNPVHLTVANSTGAIFVNLTTPSDGATLQNVVAVNATAYDTRLNTSDGAGISQVQFYLLQDSTPVASHQELTASYDWSLDVAGLATADYVLEAIAFNDEGDSAVSHINVHVIGNPRPASSWAMMFSDEFNGPAGSSPDPAKWTLPSYDRRPNSSGPDGYWNSNNAYLDGNGNLVIRVVKLPSGDYSSACVSTQSESSDGGDVNGAKFSQTYGKFECRAKLPTQQGWWVAFWMMQGNQGSIGNGGVDGSEVDIMEAWGWTNKINHAIHWDGYSTSAQSVSTSDYPQCIRNGYHVYTLIWDPDMYYFYIDSVEVWRTVGGGVCNQPGFLQLTGEISTESWAVDPSWSNDPAGAVYPDSFLVDWVRVYKDESTGVGESTATPPTNYALSKNFPNPFNLSTTLDYQLKDNSYATLKVYDVLGREIATLADGFRKAGKYSVVFDGSRFPSGVYFVRLVATPDSHGAEQDAPLVGNKPLMATIKMLMVK